ncbi:anti-sigma factor domain-containing protein [Paenibacillus paridis]|uniref:anti-sigma-I factor RsgI family protein n=1 Tax=Paenibacillus paridis TaxID=2583376 RepID=UPI0011231CAB|nr:anti-sigma factor domain-containing protein [Paenibacillus paridis]
MKRGVVMSIHKQHAVVMTADGQFLQAPIQGTPQIGEEITFEDEYRKPRPFKPAYWYSGAAAAVVLLMLLPFWFYMQKDMHPVVAYMSMDINPSVELGVDRQGKVRELHALNEDGEQIIQGLEFKGVSAEEVAASILQRAKGSHYLDTPDKDIFITSMLVEGNSALQLDYENILTGKVDRTLRSLLAQLAAEAVSANVTTLSIPSELRDEAAANGISSGKMAVYLMAKDEGYELELEQLKQQSIDKVTEPIGGVKTIVDKAADTSKEKLKQLVEREKEEKVKQAQSSVKPAAVKPSATPNASKPPKAAKPQKPTASEINKGGATAKPNKNGTWGGNQPTKPDKSNKPSSPNKPNTGKNDNKKDDKNDDKKDDKNNNKDKDKDKWGNWKDSNNKDRNGNENSNWGNNDDHGNDHEYNRNGWKKGDRDSKKWEDKRKDTKQDKENRSERYDRSRA